MPSCRCTPRGGSILLPCMLCVASSNQQSIPQRVGPHCFGKMKTLDAAGDFPPLHPWLEIACAWPGRGCPFPGEGRPGLLRLAFRLGLLHWFKTCARDRVSCGTPRRRSSAFAVVQPREECFASQNQQCFFGRRSPSRLFKASACRQQCGGVSLSLVRARVACFASTVSSVFPLVCSWCVHHVLTARLLANSPCYACMLAIVRTFCPWVPKTA